MSPGKQLFFDRPATYQIRVMGRVSPDWSDLLAGMSVFQSIGEDNRLVTTLEGELRDQAALAGVMNTLYELHLLVLSVLCQSRRPE
jgi:hypothetical protein